MKLPKELTTATKLSKYLARLVFIALPIVGFFLGMRYQEMVDLTKRQEIEANLSIPRAPTPTPLFAETSVKDGEETANWKTYVNSKYGFTFKYPSDYKEYREVFPDYASSYNYNLGTQVYTPDTKINENVGSPISGVEIRSFVISIPTHIEAEKSSNLSIKYPVNPPIFDNTLIPSGLKLPEGVTTNAYVRRQYATVNFFTKYENQEILIQFQCIGDKDRCKLLLPQILSTFQFLP